jgi:hypothetical protein
VKALYPMGYKAFTVKQDSEIAEVAAENRAIATVRASAEQLLDVRVESRLVDAGADG